MTTFNTAVRPIFKTPKMQIEEIKKIWLDLENSENEEQLQNFLSVLGSKLEYIFSQYIEVNSKNLELREAILGLQKALYNSDQVQQQATQVYVQNQINVNDLGFQKLGFLTFDQYRINLDQIEMINVKTGQIIMKSGNVITDNSEKKLMIKRINCMIQIIY
jgi:hypothetical protein